MRDYFKYNGLNSADYSAYVADVNQFDMPTRDVAIISIPGRNGTLSIDNGRYNNVSLTYNMYIRDSAPDKLKALRAGIASSGYARLEDSLNPDEYYLARYVSGLEMVDSNKKSMAFDLTFDRKPQRFLKSGEEAVSISNGGKIKNPTLFDALPIIRAYGNGSLTVGEISIKISGASGYTDIDCDLQEVYKDTLADNKNSLVTLNDGKFPYLVPGINTVTFTGFTKIEIKPNWWTI